MGLDGKWYTVESVEPFVAKVSPTADERIVSAEKSRIIGGYGRVNEGYQLNGNVTLTCSPDGSQFQSHLTIYDDRSKFYGKENKLESYGKCTAIAEIVKNYASQSNPVSIYVDHASQTVVKVEYHLQ